jgi:hypothetical protein
MYKPGAGSDRACKELCVIRRLILVVLKHLPILAAGLVTAIFIFHQPTPLGLRQAPAGKLGHAGCVQAALRCEPQLLPDLAARMPERALPVW